MQTIKVDSTRHNDAKSHLQKAMQKKNTHAHDKRFMCEMEEKSSNTLFNLTQIGAVCL